MSLAKCGPYIYTGSFAGALYLSSNNGGTWIPTSLNAPRIQSIIVNNSYIFAGAASGVYISSDSGFTWTQTSLNNQWVYGLGASGSNIIAGTGTGIYLSTNNGLTWTLAMASTKTIRCIAVNSSRVFAGSDTLGVYMSTNNGANWKQSSLNNLTIYSLAANGNTIFAGDGVEFMGVYLSTNNGANWAHTSLSGSIWSLAVEGTNVFAGIQNNRVYLSTDNGGTWTQRSEGMFSNILTIYSLMITTDYVFAASYQYAVWRRPIQEITGITPVSSGVPGNFKLYQNYPDPFNPVTVIIFDLPEPGDVRLAIYNTLGQEAAVLVNSRYEAGSYSVRWDASNYPSGVYFYKISAGAFSYVRKMVLIK